jgi:hypothetical protein
MRTRHLLTSRPHPVLLSIVIPIYNEQDALLAYNPVIEIYRRVATKVRTEDERRSLSPTSIARASISPGCSTASSGF